MPYGDLVKQAVQRYANHATWTYTSAPSKSARSTSPTSTGASSSMPEWTMSVSSARQRRRADIVVWTAATTTCLFTNLTCSSLWPITSSSHELAYYPGESNLRAADVVVINKVDTADLANIALVRERIRWRQSGGDHLPRPITYLCRRCRTAIRGKHVLVVEAGPTLTHGGMAYGAGRSARQTLFGAAEIIDPALRVGSILATYKKYPTPDRCCRPSG